MPTGATAEADNAEVDAATTAAASHVWGRYVYRKWTISKCRPGQPERRKENTNSEKPNQYHKAINHAKKQTSRLMKKNNRNPQNQKNASPQALKPARERQDMAPPKISIAPPTGKPAEQGGKSASPSKTEPNADQRNRPTGDK